MSEEDLKRLPIGTVLSHASGYGVVVVGHDSNGFPIVVRQLTATNPSEWRVFSKPHKEPTWCDYA
jgi:hypothetical protein